MFALVIHSKNIHSNLIFYLFKVFVVPALWSPDLRCAVSNFYYRFDPRFKRKYQPVYGIGAKIATRSIWVGKEELKRFVDVSIIDEKLWLLSIAQIN